MASKLTPSADASKTLSLSTDPWLRADAYRWRGAARVSLGEFNRALADMTHAIQLQPKRVLYYLERARCHRRLGQLEEMRDDARRVVTLSKDSNRYWDVRYCMAAYELLEQPQQVLKLYRYKEHRERVEILA